MDVIEELFTRKTVEAANIVRTTDKSNNEVAVTELPFEVNKVLYKINEETQRRQKLFKRKQ